ncbi:hypothetical protein [Caldifermentibacillus hisashii]
MTVKPILTDIFRRGTLIFADEPFLASNFNAQGAVQKVNIKK